MKLTRLKRHKMTQSLEADIPSSDLPLEEHNGALLCDGLAALVENIMNRLEKVLFEEVFRRHGMKIIKQSYEKTLGG